MIKHLLTIRQLVNQGKLRFYWNLVQSILKKEKVTPQKIIESNEKREIFMTDHINELKLIVVNRHPTIMGFVKFFVRPLLVRPHLNN